MKMLLGGFYYKANVRIQFDPLEFPNEHSLVDMLNILERKTGIIGLEQESSNEFGNNELTLYAENGNYLVLYGCYDEDGDYLVSTLNNEKKFKSEMIDILGEPYPACSITEDFIFVKELFIGFLLTGKPSSKLTK